MHRPQRNTKCRPNEKQTPQHVHQMGLSTVARINARHRPRIVTQDQDRLVTPTATPNDTCQNHWQQLQQGDAFLVEAQGPGPIFAWPLHLQPSLQPHGTTPEAARGVRYKLHRWRSRLEHPEKGNPVPGFQEHRPPHQVQPECHV